MSILTEIIGMSTLNEHMAACCQQRLSNQQAQELKASGFDFTILIPIVIQVLTEMLSGCFKQASEAEVLATLAKGDADPRVKHAAWRAAGKATNYRLSMRSQMNLALGVCDAARTATDPQRAEFVTEVKTATDWEMV